jgi:PAS domain S-box-containing protein
MMSERSQVLGCRRNGEVFPLEATITQVQAAGSLTYTAHLRDVTERNRAREQLEETERRIRAVFDHAIDALALLAPDGAVLEINQAGAALTTGGETLVGTPLWKIHWLGAAQDEADTERLQAAIHAAAMGQAGKFDATLSRDGNPLPLEVHLTPISGPNGHISYVLVEGRLAKA